MMKTTIGAIVLVSACALAGGPASGAQDESLVSDGQTRVVGPHDRTYGTASTTNYVVQAYEFLPSTGAGTTFISNSAGARACTSPCTFTAPVMLPAGAVIVAMEMEACDTDPAGQVNMNLIRQPQLEAPFQNLGFVQTGVAAAPGCAFFTLTLGVPHTVTNETATYQLRGDAFGTSLATRLQAVRIVYRLQVSPAPATATFPVDVPTSHPFFRFVEALAAAGITGGCSAGSYCPDSPVTRGQMAVFLATALGLHFPN